MRTQVQCERDILSLVDSINANENREEVELSSPPQTGVELGSDSAASSSTDSSTDSSTKSTRPAAEARQSVYWNEHRNKPLWKIHRIVNTQSGEPLTRQKDAAGRKLKRVGLSAVVFRVHHAIGDGLSLIGLMPKLFNDE
jgi:hypothetical protein